jgi:hypothetical protein
MGCCSSVEGIGVYVRKSHWAHALIKQSEELGDAVREDDDQRLKWLLDTGADMNTLNLDGHSLLGIAMRGDHKRCRALLEARGAHVDLKHSRGNKQRALPQRPQLEATEKQRGEGARTIQGRGLRDPGGAVWAAVMNAQNNFRSFHLHFRRGANPATLTDTDAASSSEKSWMFAYAGVEYPRTLSLIVWRRSSMIVMSVSTLVHGVFQFWGAFSAHDQWKQSVLDSKQTLDMTNVSARYYWTASPEFTQEILADNATNDGTDISFAHLCREFSTCASVTTDAVLEGLADSMSSFDSCDPTSSFFRNCTYFDAPRLESFAEYSLRMADVGLSRMLLDADEKSVWILFAVATCAILAWVCNMLAMSSWYNLKKSKRWILIGWLCTFVAPFMISIMPMRMFVDWRAMDPVREAYFRNFKEHFRLAEKEQLVRDTCEPIVNGTYRAQVMRGYDQMESKIEELIGWYDGAPCMDDEILSGGGLFCDCDLPIPTSVPGATLPTGQTTTAPCYAASGASCPVAAFPTTSWHPPPAVVRSAGGYFPYLQKLHEARVKNLGTSNPLDPAGPRHLVDFTCQNFMSGMSFADKKAICIRPINSANLSQNFLANELRKAQYTLPKQPGGPTSSFLRGIDISSILPAELNFAVTSNAWALNLLTVNPVCPAGATATTPVAQCSMSIFPGGQSTPAGQLPSWMETTPLVEVCPASCGGCGQLGDMISISMSAFAMIDRVTATSMNEAHDIVDGSFAATKTSVGTTFDGLVTSSESVTSGIDSACDTLDDWAPLINTASDVGKVFSSFFRRLEDVQSDDWWPSGLEQLRAARSNLKSTAASLHKRNLLLPLVMTEPTAQRRRLGPNEDCRGVQQDAQKMTQDTRQGKTDTLNSIQNTHTATSQAMNHAERQIRSSIRTGRNMMLQSFETTRKLTTTIRANMGSVRNGTDSVFDFMASGCVMIVSQLTNPPGNAEGAYAAVEDMIIRLQQPVELTIGLMHAFAGFKTMVPAAIAIAPGMMKGALLVKMLVPQSSLPGVFVVMLPWLYCPIMWCLYNFAFQMIGNPFMLVGMLLLAYAPMVNVIVGEWKSIAQPMNDKDIISVTKAIDSYAMMLMLIAVACVIAFLYHIKDAEQVRSINKKDIAVDILQNMLQGRVLVELVVSTVSKRFYTTLAGVDYMVGTIVEDRRFEVMLMELQRPPKEFRGCCGRKINDVLDQASDNGEAGKRRRALPELPKLRRALPELPQGNSTDDDDSGGGSCRAGCCCCKKDQSEAEVEPLLSEREELEAVFKDRQIRLDDLCKLMYVGADKSFMKKKEIGMAAARQQRSELWLQATKRKERKPAGYLTITVHGAQGLINAEMAAHADLGSSTQSRVPNSYVVLELEQGLVETSHTQKTQTWATDKCPSTAPQWDGSNGDGEAARNIFKIAIHDISDVRLYAHVYDHVTVGRDEFLGEAMISNADILSLMSTLGQPKSQQMMLLSCVSQSSKIGSERFSKECRGGFLRISTQFDFPNVALGTLKVEVVSAQGLLAADVVIGGEDSSDPFATVTVEQIRDGENLSQKYRTKKVERTLDPVWDASFFFDLFDMNATLWVDVYDADAVGDDYLGQVGLSLRRFCMENGQSTTEELTLTPCSPQRGLPNKAMQVAAVTGSVTVRLTFDKERSRLDLTDRKLAERLETAMQAQDLSESHREYLRKLNDESKLQFIVSVGSQTPQRSSTPPRDRRRESTSTPPKASLAPRLEQMPQPVSRRALPPLSTQPPTIVAQKVSADQPARTPPPMPMQTQEPLRPLSSATPPVQRTQSTSQRRLPKLPDHPAALSSARMVWPAQTTGQRQLPGLPDTSQITRTPPDLPTRVKETQEVRFTPAGPVTAERAERLQSSRKLPPVVLTEGSNRGP